MKAEYFKISNGDPDSDLIPPECFEHQQTVCIKRTESCIELYYVADQDESEGHQDVEWFDIPEVPDGAIKIRASAFQRMTGGI